MQTLPLSERLSIGPAGLLRHSVLSGHYYPVLGTHTYASPEVPSNEPIHFTSSYEALPTATSLTLAQEAARAERAMGWLLLGLLALLLAAGCATTPRAASPAPDPLVSVPHGLSGQAWYCDYTSDSNSL